MSGKNWIKNEVVKNLKYIKVSKQWLSLFIVWASIETAVASFKSPTVSIETQTKHRFKGERIYLKKLK